MRVLLIALLLWALPLGVLAQSMEQLKKAEQLYYQGIEHLKAKRTQQAIQTLNESARLAPENGSVHWELGWAYWQNQEWPQVVAHWELTEKYKPQQKDLQKYLTLARQYASESEAPDFQPIPLESETTGDVLYITAVGDIMMGSDLKGPEYLPPKDGSQLFEPIASYLKGDIVMGNLEGPLTDATTTDKCKPGSNCYAFRTPPSYARHLKNAGFNVLNVANNHSADFGYEGLMDTLQALKSENLTYYGNLSKPFAMVTVNGTKVGILGVASFSCCLHITQIEKAQNFVRQMREQGADLVIVTMHAGAEGVNATNVPQGEEYFFGENRGDLRKFSHAMIDAGADLVLGHGPHTLRGLEIYQGKLVAYSLGNFLGYLGFSTSGHLKYTMILKVGLDRKGSLVSVQAVPAQLSPQVIPSPDPKGRAIALVNRLSREDFGENALMLDASGRWSP